MAIRCIFALVGAMLATMSALASDTSEPALVFLRPEKSSFWRTATNNTMNLPVNFPRGAESAVLSVKGVGYAREYTGIKTTEYLLTLPPPTSPDKENVYELTLAFDDGTTNSARLGLVQGLGQGDEGWTRCLTPASGKEWRDILGKAVLPIPYGMTSFTVDGQETDTKLNGAQGWYALGKIARGQTVDLSMTADGVEYSVSLLGSAYGFTMILR